ncbi:MAG: hypothetical protein DRP82_04630 [Planctomycetota bacterium]|nr:MAG: hypothetical protein DRP82_04630 [Planctomycetota bacterium]
MRYIGLRVLSLLYGVVGWILLAGGAVLAVLSAIAAGSVTVFFFVLATVLLYALLFLGVGQFLRLLLDTEQNIRRAVDAVSEKSEF